MSRAIVLLVAFLGAVSAAPHHYHHRGPFHSHTYLRNHAHDPFQDEFFDTNAFWSELSVEMAEFNRAMQEFTRHFPASVADEGVQGSEYKISIPLTGFLEKDIVVKAREGVLMIQAVHKNDGGSEKHYLDVRTLPAYVNVSGSWTYDNGVLKIVFPVTGTVELPRGEPAVTSAPESEEQMETTNSSEHVPDADVGLDRSVDEGNREILTNEISSSKVEATTYAVDLKNEVEFVPVRY